MTIYELGGFPIDRQALSVVLGGEHYTPDVKSTAIMFDAQPLFAEIRRNRNEILPEDMRGKKLGRLKVIGYWGCEKSKKSKGAKGQKWVCLCSCGMYCIRNAYTIKNHVADNDMCNLCRHVDYLKRRDRSLQAGEYIG